MVFALLPHTEQGWIPCHLCSLAVRLNDLNNLIDFMILFPCLLSLLFSMVCFCFSWRYWSLAAIIQGLQIFLICIFFFFQLAKLVLGKKKTKGHVCHLFHLIKGFYFRLSQHGKAGRREQHSSFSHKNALWYIHVHVPNSCV